MMTKILYRLRFTLLSPLAISSGSNENTDKDAIVDAQGHPVIPATAIAGALRSELKKRGITVPVAQKKSEDRYVPLEHLIFGYIPTDKNDASEQYPTCVRFYDATLDADHDDFFITNRDCVALQNKVGIKGAKFDLEAVEPGAEFVGFMELLSEKYDAEKALLQLLAAMNDGVIRFGGKTSRGYGRVSVTVQKKRISDMEEWIAFDQFDPTHWENADTVPLAAEDSGKLLQLEVRLHLKSGISIREYSTNVNAADYRSLSLHDAKTTAVVPGTSWAGAFRSRFTELAGENGKQAADKLFGFVEQKTGKTQKSRIFFTESAMLGGTRKLSTRNSIDRFSAATKAGALYTENTHFYGDTVLQILIRDPEPAERRLLNCCLADLHYGLLAVGGLTSVGRGLFEIQSVNGKPFDAYRKEVFADET